MSIPDFSIVPLSILSDPEITFRELKVYIAINSFSDQQKGECSVSRSVLAEMTNLPIERISEVTSLLEEKGWIIKSGDGGRSTPCCYSILSKDLIERNFGIRLSGNVWEKIRTEVFSRDNHTCQYCGAKNVEIHCDHIIPICKGGGNDMDNLITACEPCNRLKGGKLLEEWRS